MTLLEQTAGKEISATHAAYLALRRLILTGKLPAGQKLKIEQLRAMLKTGASPVREALSLLTSDMLVERLDQRGFRAAPVSLGNFHEILSLRCVMEDMALRKSIERATPAWEEHLVLAHHRMKRASSGGGIPEFEDAHKSFHMTLLNNADSPILERYCSQLYDLNIRYRYLAAGGTNYKKRDIAAEHEEILDAAILGNSDAAAAALIRHYQATGGYLSILLSKL
mgnify:CR=1 FL=1